MGSITDDELVKMHLSGMTLSAVGETVGLSRERVRQRVRQAGVTSEQTREIQRQSYHKAWIPRTCETCGKEWRTRSSIHPRFCSRRCVEVDQRLKPDDLLDWLRTLARRLGRTPSQNDLNAADGPSHTTYYSHFGSLRAAQEQAGLKPNACFGERHPSAKLTEAEVRAIRRRLIDAASQGSLARELGVSRATINSIAHRHTWKHVE